MPSEPRASSSDAIEPLPEYVTFTSQAYEADADAAAAAGAIGWLEEQSQHPFIREVAGRTAELLELQAAERVLEVGCGTGVFLPDLARSVMPGGHVTGLDHSAQFLAQARTRIAAEGVGDAIDLVQADAMHLPFADDTFDVAHCERVLMHLEDPDLAIREMLRVVRPGGRVVAAEIFANGATVDAPDPEVARLLSNALVSGIRNPDMGLQLRRRFLEAGLAGLRGAVVGYFEEELDEGEAREYEHVASALVARGSLDASRAAAAMAALRDARERGVYCGLSLMFVVAGRVPGA